MWQDLNSRTTEYPIRKADRNQKTICLFITLKKEKTDMLQKELAKRRRARHGTETDAETFCNRKSAIFIIMQEKNPNTFFMISLIFQQLY